MDIKTTAIWLHRDDEYTDEFGKRHKAMRIDSVPQADGYYVYVEGQGYPEFYLRTHAVTIHVPDRKFKPGDWVTARSGKGDVYQINRVFKDRWGHTYYDFDNGSVDVRKRNRSGWHEADRADKGYKKLSDD
jgi:hypothetical protein